MDKTKFRGSSTWKHKRAEILARDKNQCVICGGTEQLQVHHIYRLDTHPTLKLENSNLISLCKTCHNKAHNNVFSEYYLLQQISK